MLLFSEKYKRFFCILLLMILGFAPVMGQNFQIIGKKCPSSPQSECGIEPLLFVDLDKDATAWLWDFGDGSAPATGQSVRHAYASAGSYTISLSRTKNGVVPIPVTENITIGSLPAMPAFRSLTGNVVKDTTICEVPLTLNPYPLLAPNNVTYKWYPKGETTQKLDVSKSGCYSVEVKSGECTVSAKINVTVCLEDGGAGGGDGVQWFFGDKAGIKFQQTQSPPTTPPTEAVDSGTLFDAPTTTIIGTDIIPTTTSGLNAPEAVTVVYSPEKALLFYSDGVDVYNKDHQKMLFTLSGSKTASQLTVVPRTLCRACNYFDYYAFTNDGGKLTYSIVDMRENGGLGGITVRNQLLGQDIAEGIATVPKGDSAYYIITHDIGSNRFRILTLDSTGVQMNTQDIGTVVHSGVEAQNVIKAFPIGNKIAMLIPANNLNDNYLEIYEFDAAAGVLKNPQRISLGKAPPTAYGFDFSPDGKRLYVSFQGNPRSGIPSELRQYNLVPPVGQTIEQSNVLIDSSPNLIFGAVQLSPSEENGGDDRVYMAISGAADLAVIDNPNALGKPAIAYQRDGQTLQGRTSTLGLPNIIFSKPNSQGQGISVSFSGACTNKPTIFQVQPPCGDLPKLYDWDFGDGQTLGPLPNIKMGIHTYKQPGKYTVKLRIRIRKDLIPFDIGGIAQQVLETLFAQTCKDTTITDEIEIVESPEKPNLGGTKKSCSGKSVELSTTSRGDKYIWLKDNAVLAGETSNKIQATQSGIYQVVVSNKFCSEQAQVRVAFIPPPNYKIDTQDPTTCGKKDGQLAVRILGPPDTYTYEWYQSGRKLNETSETLKGLEAGNYSVKIIPNITCEVTENVSLSPPFVNLGVKVDKVENANCAKLNGGAIITSITKGTPQIYNWRDQSGNLIGTVPTLQNVPKGVYNLEVKDAQGCAFYLNNLQVGLDGNLNVNLGPDATLCEGEEITLDAGVGENFAWSTGASFRKIIIRQSGTYRVTVSGTDPTCRGTDDIKLTFVPAPQVSLPAEINFCKSDVGSVQIDPKATGNGLRYEWIPTGGRNPTLTVNTPGEYAVKVTNSEGCTLERKTTVLDKCNPSLYIPDAFTPNNDGVNDDLAVFGSNIVDFELYVYNRWGELIFVSNDLNTRWDGTFKNNPCPMEVYAYLVRFRSRDFPTKGLQSKRGSVILLR